MSTQRGNAQRSRSQKHQNSKAFKNSLHDTNKKSLAVNNLIAEDCCARCTDIIQWKIKYKKYKTLTVPKKCIKCNQKSVKRAYCIVCHPCVVEFNICAKCNQAKDIIVPGGLTEEEKIKQMAQLDQELKFLPERKRRTFLRLQATGKLTDELGVGAGGDDAEDSTDPADTDSDEGSVCDDESGDDEKIEEKNKHHGRKKMVNFVGVEGNDPGDNAVDGPLSGAECPGPVHVTGGDQCPVKDRDTELEGRNPSGVDSEDSGHTDIEDDNVLHNVVHDTAKLSV